MIEIETEKVTKVNDKSEILLDLIPSIKKKSFITRTNIILTLFIILIFFSSVVIEAILKNNELERVLLLAINFFVTNGSDESIFSYYINNTDRYCAVIGDENLSYISHSLAFLLVIVSMFLTWRERLCVNFCFSRPGLPSIMSPFRKHDRLNSALVYGLIATNIIELIFQLLLDTKYKGVFKDIDTTQDPTGLAILLLQIVNVCIISLRYYPLLICFETKSLILYVLSSVYLTVDFINEIYKEAKCSKLDVQLEKLILNETTIDRIRKSQSYQMSFDIINLVPSLYFHTHILVILVYESTKYFKKDKKNDKLVNRDLRFYSNADIRYCIQLFKKNVQSSNESLFNKYVYKWNDHFRFSSRVINSHVVAFLSLFYFWSFWTYYGFIILNALEKPELIAIFDEFRELIKMQFGIDLPIDLFAIKIDHKLLFIFSSLTSGLICLIQSLLGLKSIKTQLQQGYRGINLKKDSYLTKPVDLATGSSHFSGYLIGFLINGFLFIFGFIFLVYFILYFLFKYLSESLLNIFLWILPILVVYFTKLLADYSCSKFLFLQKNGKYLALDNSKVYSLFLYIMFFIDCFTGFLAALFRLLTGLIGALFFMPRIGYSYLGRQIEEWDTGFQVFNGFLSMEIAHSHPILISFCALSYYRRFDSKPIIYNSLAYLKKYLKNSLKQSQEKATTIVDQEFQIQNRKKLIINKWFLYVTLVNNNSLIQYRKTDFSYRRIMGVNNIPYLKREDRA